MLEAVASGEKLAALLEAPEARSDKVAALGLPVHILGEVWVLEDGGTPKIWHTQSQGKLVGEMIHHWGCPILRGILTNSFAQEVIMAVVQKDGLLLRFAHDSLKDFVEHVMLSRKHPW